MSLRTRLKPVLFAAATLVLAAPAHADLPRAALDGVTVAPPPHAALPAGVVFKDAAGRAAMLTSEAERTPQVLVFADYACTTLCGPALSIVGARLKETGLRAGADYRLQVVGLNPASTAAEAAAFGRARLPPDLPADFLTGAAPAIAAATRSLGYRYAFDARSGAYAHPVAAFVLTADGRLTRALSEVALTTPSLRASLQDAKRGSAPGIVESVALACHGALEAIGRFDGAILLGLRAAALLLLALGAAVLVGLSRRRRPST